MFGPSTPATVRDLIGLSFLHRERARFCGPASVLLDRAFERSGAAIDVGAIDALTSVESIPSGVRAGAFASLETLGAAAPDLMPPGISPAAARLRLALLGATVSVASVGALRTARIDALVLAPYEVPVTIDIPRVGAGTGFAERRRTTNDGDASFALTVAVALRVADASFGDVRIAVELDGDLRRATLAEAKLERRRLDPGLFPEAARLAAYAIEAVDARTSSAVRATTPLAMAALRDAFAAARPLEPVPVRRKATPRRGFLGAFALGMLAAALPATAPAQPVDRLDAVRARKRLRIGLTGDYKPFSFVAEDGTWSGLDVEVAQRLARALGVDLEIVKTSWPTMAADLGAGKFDVAMGGVSRSPDRAALGLLSRTYVVDGKVALVRAADRAKFTSLADFDRPAVRVAVNPGGTNAQFVATFVTHATVTVVDKNLAIAPLVADGTYDVMFTDGVEAAYDVQHDPRLAVFDPAHPFTHVEKVYWIARDGPQLAAFIDGWMKAGEADGTFAKLRTAYIGSNLNAPPPSSP
jgi:cyclohexadienyl dehydratase